MVTVIDCYGTPYEIGLAHGKGAKAQINKLIDLYSGFNIVWLNKKWDELKPLAEAFKETLASKVPYVLEEIQGIADGAGRDVLDIVILNARYEIGLAGAAFDQATTTKDPREDAVDGCTTFGEMYEGTQWIGQNWDWQGEVLDNMVFLNIYPSDKSVPSCKVIAEAGLLGQTGMNEHGVGLVVNALYAADMDTSKIPCTLIRRIMLRQDTKEKAIAEMQRLGVAALSHILIADKTGAVSIETSPLESMSYIKPVDDILTHTNHCVMPPKGVSYKDLVEDSRDRFDTMDNYLREHKNIPASYEKYLVPLKDEKNYPLSVNRARNPAGKGTTNTIQTIYTVLMDLKNGVGRVSFDRPTEPKSVVDFRFI